MKRENRCLPLFFIVLLALMSVLASCGRDQAEAKVIADADLVFTLETAIVDGRMVFLGVGGAIDGVVNPDLAVQIGQRVHLTVINGDGIPHDLAIPAFQITTPPLSGKGVRAEVDFVPTTDQQQPYNYFCTVAGHRQVGMEGNIAIR